MLNPGNYKIDSYSETPLEDYLKEYSSDREDFSTPIPENPAPASDSASPQTENGPGVPSPGSGLQSEKSEIITGPSPEELKILKGKREFTAKFLAKNTDRLFAFFLSIVADDEDTEDWKANPEDVEDLREAYFEMAQSYGWGGMPPWLTLVIALGLTYGPMFPEANKVRRINKALVEKAAREEAERMAAEERARISEEKAAKLENENQNEVSKFINDTTDGSSE